MTARRLEPIPLFRPAPDEEDIGFPVLSWSGIDDAPPSRIRPVPLADGTLLCVSGRLDETPALPGMRHRTAGDDGIFAAAWEHWGADAARHLYGDFALAHWNPQTRHLTLVRDAVGGRALYYAVTDGEIGFATTLEGMIALLRPPVELDERAVAELLTHSLRDPERTLYRGIHRVPAGGRACFGPGFHRTDTYWGIDSIPEIRFRRDEHYVEQGRDLLDRAVRSRIPGDGPIVTMLSGGFDSAGITTTVARQAEDRQIIALTRAPGAPVTLDTPGDPELAAHVAAACPQIDWRVIDDDPRTIDWSAELAEARFAVPVGGAFAGPWFNALVRATRGLAPVTVLAGLAGNSVLSWNGTIPRPSGASEPRRQPGLAEAMRRAVANRQLRGAGLASALKAMALPWGPSPRLAPGRPEMIPMISAGFAASLGHVVHNRWEAAQMDQVRLRIANLQNPMFADVRAWSWHNYGRPVLDPYRNRRLVEFALGVPNAQYLRDGRPRWLARQVLSDRVPDIILRQRRRVDQCPEWHALASARRAASFEALAQIEASPLASRVLDLPRMRAALRDWPSTVSSTRANEYPHGFALHWALRVGMFLRRFDARRP